MTLPPPLSPCSPPPRPLTLLCVLLLLLLPLSPHHRQTSNQVSLALARCVLLNCSVDNAPHCSLLKQGISLITSYYVWAGNFTPIAWRRAGCLSPVIKSIFGFFFFVCSCRLLSRSTRHDRLHKRLVFFFAKIIREYLSQFLPR